MDQKGVHFNSKDNMKVTLDEEFIHSGKLYGPGTIDVEDEKAAKDLIAANLRVREARGKASPFKPNGVMAAPGEPVDTNPLNGVPAQDVAAKQHQDGVKAATEAAAKEEAEKAAANKARGIESANRAKK